MRVSEAGTRFSRGGGYGSGFDDRYLHCSLSSGWDVDDGDDDHHLHPQCVMIITISKPNCSFVSSLPLLTLTRGAGPCWPRMRC